MNAVQWPGTPAVTNESDLAFAQIYPFFTQGNASEPHWPAATNQSDVTFCAESTDTTLQA